MIQSSVYKNPTDFIYFTGFAIVTLQKVATTHYCGQRIISKSEEILTALYEVSWTPQNKKMEKDLIPLMAFNQTPMKINVMGFYDLDLKNFAKV
jgi:7tm Odorant receptor